MLASGEALGGFQLHTSPNLPMISIFFQVGRWRPYVPAMRRHRQRKSSCPEVLTKRTQGLTEREGEIMSILWNLDRASVEEIRGRLKNRPSSNTVRTLLGIMVERGLEEDDGSA